MGVVDANIFGIKLQVPVIWDENSGKPISPESAGLVSRYSNDPGNAGGINGEKPCIHNKGYLLSILNPEIIGLKQDMMNGEIYTRVNSGAGWCYVQAYSTVNEIHWQCWGDKDHTNLRYKGDLYATEVILGRMWLRGPTYQYWQEPGGYFNEDIVADYPKNQIKSGLRGLQPSSLWWSKQFELLHQRKPIPSGLASECYREAMNSINFNTNTLANVIDIVETVKDMKSGKIFKSLSNASKLGMLSSAWMSYRYAYTTTIMDAKEYAEKVGRLCDYFVNVQNILISRSGRTTENGSYHVKVIYREKRQNDCAELYRKLKRVGACPDLYNLWDLVPMSFVVDWFLPIGDFLEDYSSNWVTTPGYFEILSITSSWKVTDSKPYGCGRLELSSYTRNVTQKPPEFATYSEDPSRKTVVKRFIDGAALLIQ